MAGMGGRKTSDSVDFGPDEFGSWAVSGNLARALT